MKRPMGNFLVEQRTKDSMDSVPSFDELMNKETVFEDFRSLKDEFAKKKEFDYSYLISFNQRLFVCLCSNEDRNELCEMMSSISELIVMARPIDFSIKSRVGKTQTTKTYLMVDDNTGLYKIGKSKNPNFREKTLQSEKPTIEMLFVIDKDVECELHQKFSHKRVRGEWFRLDNEDVEYLRKKYTEKYLPSVLQKK